jgi:DNA-binding CsgD family transcriptional regulator
VVELLLRVALTAEHAKRPFVVSQRGTVPLKTNGQLGNRQPPGKSHPRRSGSSSPTCTAGLTAREAEVIGLLGRGLQTKQIARALGISDKTADRHIQNAYAKMGVSTRAAATLFAMARAGGMGRTPDCPAGGPLRSVSLNRTSGPKEPRCQSTETRALG